MSKRPISRIAPGWWDYTTLDRELLDDAARADGRRPAAAQPAGIHRAVLRHARGLLPGRSAGIHHAWRQATPTRPAGICGPIGPTEQLPLVARLVNELELDLRHCHFWGMDEWVVDGKEAAMDFPLSFARADMELCFNRIRPELRMPRRTSISQADDPADYIASWDAARCVVMQGGQGEVKHWAFNDPPQRTGKCDATRRRRPKNTAS